MAQQASSSCNDTQKIFFGLSVGPTIDWFAPTNDAIIKKNAKGGFIAGADINFALAKTTQIYFATGVLVRYLQGDFSFNNRYLFPSPTDTLEISTVRTYQTTYITVPTGIKFRTKSIKKCVFLGKIGLYHNFRVGGNQVDNFSFPGENAPISPKYYISTEKVKNKDAAFFAESGYFGLGFEYLLGKSRVFVNVDYSCQFNYFSKKAKSNITAEQFKSIVHSLHIVFGFYF